MTGTLKRVLKAQNRTKPKPHQQITVQPNEQKRHNNLVKRDELRDKVANDVAAYLSSGGKIDRVERSATGLTHNYRTINTGKSIKLKKAKQ
jgi:exoribonuclease II